VSGDGGKTWEQVRPLQQQLTDAGQLWSWVRFSHVLTHFDPDAPGAEITVRAWDCAANTQPDWPNWNYTGMLNNHLYRVRVATTPQGHRVFVHPTQWMDSKFEPFLADAVSEALVPFEGNRSRTLSGGWKIGQFSNATVNLTLEEQTKMVVSDEARFAGQKLVAKVCCGVEGELCLTAEFGGLQVEGTVSETSDGRQLLRWQNGMCWQKFSKPGDGECSTMAGSEQSTPELRSRPVGEPETLVPVSVP